MNIQEQKEVVKRKIEEVNDKILEVEKALIITKANELESLTIESIFATMDKLRVQEKALKYLQVDLRDLYDKYTYLLELEVEERRGEPDKQHGR